MNGDKKKQKNISDIVKPSLKWSTHMMVRLSWLKWENWILGYTWCISMSSAMYGLWLEGILLFWQSTWLICQVEAGRPSSRGKSRNILKMNISTSNRWRFTVAFLDQSDKMTDGRRHHKEVRQSHPALQWMPGVWKRASTLLQLNVTLRRNAAVEAVLLYKSQAEAVLGSQEHNIQPNLQYWKQDSSLLVKTRHLAGTLSLALPSST